MEENETIPNNKMSQWSASNSITSGDHPSCTLDTQKQHNTMGVHPIVKSWIEQSVSNQSSIIFLNQRLSFLSIQILQGVAREKYRKLPGNGEDFKRKIKVQPSSLKGLCEIFGGAPILEPLAVQRLKCQLKPPIGPVGLNSSCKAAVNVLPIGRNNIPTQSHVGLKQKVPGSSKWPFDNPNGGHLTLERVT